MLQIWSFSNKWLHEIGYILVALSGLLDSNLHHILLDISLHWTKSIILVLNQLTERNSSLLQHTEKLYHPKGKKRFWLIIENLKLSQSWKMLKSTTHKNSRNAPCYELSIDMKVMMSSFPFPMSDTSIWLCMKIFSSKTWTFCWYHFKRKTQCQEFLQWLLTLIKAYPKLNYYCQFS